MRRASETQIQSGSLLVLVLAGIVAGVMGGWFTTSLIQKPAACLRRGRLGQRTAQVAGGLLRRAPGARCTGRRTQSLNDPLLRSGLRVQQVHRRQVGIGCIRGEQPAGEDAFVEPDTSDVVELEALGAVGCCEHQFGIVAAQLGAPAARVVHRFSELGPVRYGVAQARSTNMVVAAIVDV